MRQGLVALVVMVLWRGPLDAQNASVEISVFGRAAWFEPTATLASPNPPFVKAARHGAMESGPMLEGGIHAVLPDPIPAVRLYSGHLLGSELLLEEPDGLRCLGPVSLTTVLLEAVSTPIDREAFAGNVAVGAGVLRYGFPDISAAEVSRLFEDGTVSPAASLGIGASWIASGFTVVMDARDLISRFDSPPVATGIFPGATTDIDETQHDLHFSVGFRYPLWHP